MFLFFVLIFSLFLASQFAETDFSTIETINVGNTSVPNLNKICPEGFAVLNDACVDVDECQLKNMCPDGFYCENTFGSFDCCPPGERPIPGAEECICNHEECSKIYGRACQILGKDYGPPRCFCAHGFLWDFELLHCKPICPLGSSLNFTSYPKVDCLCPYSHEKHGSFCLKRCRNRRDCNGGNCEYHENHKVCACPRGFRLDDGKKQCIDVDECEIPRCKPNYECVNLVGGYGCFDFKCDQGFTPQKGLGRCLKKRNGMTHFKMKTVIPLIMRYTNENQTFSTTKLPKAYKFEQRKLEIHPEEFVEYIEVSIQSEDDKSQELIMKSIKPFPREGKVTIHFIARASGNAHTLEFWTNLLVSRLPFTVDIIGHD